MKVYKSSSCSTTVADGKSSDKNFMVGGCSEDLLLERFKTEALTDLSFQISWKCPARLDLQHA